MVVMAAVVIVVFVIMNSIIILIAGCSICCVCSYSGVNIGFGGSSLAHHTFVSSTALAQSPLGLIHRKRI